MLARVRQVGDVNHAVQLKSRNIDIEVARNIARQALDLDLAHHVLEDAALRLHADRHADQLNRHRDAHRLVHRNPLQVDVQQLALDRLMLPVDDHGLHRARAPSTFRSKIVLWPESECRIFVITLRVDRNRDRVLARAVDHGGNLAGDANATRRILVELALAGRCDDCFNAVDAAMIHFSFRARSSVSDAAPFAGRRSLLLHSVCGLPLDLALRQRDQLHYTALVEQRTHAGLHMNALDRPAQKPGNRKHLDLLHAARILAQRNGIRHDHLFQP